MRSHRVLNVLTASLVFSSGHAPVLAQIIGPLKQGSLQQRPGLPQAVSKGTVPGIYYDPSGEVSPSLSQLQPADKPGSFQVPSQYQSSTIRELGYDPSRAWAVGSTPDEILKIGDLQQSKYFQKVGSMTLREIASQAGTSIDTVPLSQIALIRNMTVGELYQAYPQLRKVPLREIPFLARTLAETAQNPEQLGQRALDLGSQRALKELAALDPRLANVPLNSILQGNLDEVLSQSKAAAAKVAIQEITRSHPELVNVPIADILNGNLGQVGRKVLDTAEKALLEGLRGNPTYKGIPVLQLTEGDWGGTISDLQQTQLKGILQDYPEIAQLPIDKAFPTVNGAIAGDWKTIAQQTVLEGLDLTGEDIFKAIPELKNLPLGALDIDNLSISSLSGIADRPLKTLPNIANKYLAELPGLSQIPVNKLPIDFALSALLGDLFGRLDIAYAGPVETPVVNVLSGGTKDQKFTPEPCDEKRCAHFEMDNTDGGGPPGNLSGKAWVEGGSQKVEGGKGFLASINGGKEPTGVPVWGTEAHVKLSLEDIKEGGSGKPSTARIQANFQFCINVPFLSEQCSPHFIPIPTPWQVQEGGLVLVASRSAPPDFLLRERDRIQSEYESQYAPDPYCDPGSTLATTPPPTQKIASTGKPAVGINVAQENEQRYLARIAAGESSGGRNVGPNYLGARGEYQFIPTTRAAILRKHGYDAWSSNKQIRDKAALALIEDYGRQKGVNIRAAIREGNFQYADRVLGRSQFTSLPGGAEQHVIWRNAVNRIRYGPVGKAGGPLPVFAQQDCSPVADAGGTFTQGSGKATGRFVLPAKGPVTSEIGWRVHPIRGGRRFHAGLDIGARSGAPVKASNGGKVTYAGWMGAYGNIVIVDHGDGLTTRYAHLKDFNVRQGYSVSQGQQIGRVGSTGGSTGPHLHFEVRKNGNPVNPRYYVKF